MDDTKRGDRMKGQMEVKGEWNRWRRNRVRERGDEKGKRGREGRKKNAGEEGKRTRKDGGRRGSCLFVPPK